MRVAIPVTTRLFNRFKKQQERRGINASALIRNFIEEWTAEQERKPQKKLTDYVSK